LAEQAFPNVVVFEQRATVGGMWNYTSNNLFPSTNNQNPVHGEDCPTISPLHDSLEANIPKTLMRFSDLPFPEADPLFPSRMQIQEYVRTAAEGMKHLIRFQTRVQEIRLRPGSTSRQGSLTESWIVRSLDLLSSQEAVETFDVVVVASGHYEEPSIPSIPGFSSWIEQDSTSIAHAKFYHRPEELAGKKVLIVGNYASGTDIAGQVLLHCKRPLLVSRRTPQPSEVAPLPLM
jgi:cation diffusion facilitator CzcD-associated flavoprotein CzcO